jgi:hypothetical protein
MYKIKINGFDKAIETVEFLEKKRWKFDIQINYNTPFGEVYNIVMHDKQKMFMTQLAMGV